MGLKIRTRYFTTLREVAGVKGEEIAIPNGSTIADLVGRIVAKYGKEAFNYLYVGASREIDPVMQFLVDGVSTRNLRGFETELMEGDVVAIIPPIGGGG